MKKKTAEDILRQYKSGYREFKGVIVEPPGNFAKSRLTGIIFEGASLVSCNFEKAILQRACFSAAILRNANFKAANLAKADLKGADLRGAMMRPVDLSGADLRWANLEGVDLTGSIISGANFDGANLKNACLKGTNPGKWWWKANLDEAKLDNTILPDGIVFSQPITEKPANSKPAEPLQPVEPAKPDYAKADRLYYEGLGVVASIQTQLEAGVPVNHPRVQNLIKQASEKFSEAVEISDVNWPRFSECGRYASDLVKEHTLKDGKLK